MITKLINTLAFPAPPRYASRFRSLKAHPGLVMLTTADGETIPAIYVQQPQQQASKRLLILYSHGNAEDLGLIPPFVEYMAARLNADVLAYEYVGYSISSGQPSEAGLYASAAAAYAWALSDPTAEGGGGGAVPHEIVPFGRSLGSAPACYLASTYPDVAGLLLQSPLLSGANVFLGRLGFAATCLDVFRNEDFITRVTCRVAITHGTDDGVVPCWNGKSLHRKCAQAHTPLWCEGHGHNDMPEDAILDWAKGFLDLIRDTPTGGTRRARSSRERSSVPTSPRYVVGS